MTDKPHTPTVDELRRMYALKVPYDQRDRRNAEFDRFLAAAEQRGAEKAFDEAVEEIASMEGNRLIIARYKHLNPYRADQMEGDDADA